MYCLLGHLLGHLKHTIRAKPLLVELRLLMSLAFLSQCPGQLQDLAWLLYVGPCILCKIILGFF